MNQEIFNKKGFLIFKILSDEIKSIGGYGICDWCNSTPQEGYYIAVLNHWYCEKCYQDWIKKAKYYPEDAPIELKNLSNMILKLDKTHPKQYP
jgi:hypothetical protein